MLPEIAVLRGTWSDLSSSRTVAVPALIPGTEKFWLFRFTRTIHGQGFIRQFNYFTTCVLFLPRREN